MENEFPHNENVSITARNDNSENIKWLYDNGIIFKNVNQNRDLKWWNDWLIKFFWIIQKKRVYLKNVERLLGNNYSHNNLVFDYVTKKWENIDYGMVFGR